MKDSSHNIMVYQLKCCIP